MHWYLKVLKQYADFNGRARRTEYWMFTLFNLLFGLIALLLDNVLGIAFGGVGYGPLYLIYGLLVLVPGLAVSVRRLHDVGKSGWMLLISLIPLVGAIWLLVLLFTEGDHRDNEYGANPKEAHDSEADSDAGTSNENVVLAVVIWMVLTRAYWAVMPMLMEDYFSTDWFIYVSTFLNLVWSFIPLALGLAMKGTSKKTVALVFGGLYLVHGIYEVVRALIEMG